MFGGVLKWAGVDQQNGATTKGLTGSDVEVYRLRFAKYSSKRFAHMMVSYPANSKKYLL